MKHHTAKLVSIALACLAGLAGALAVAAGPSSQVELQRLASCQHSLDNLNDAKAQMEHFVAGFNTHFSADPQGGGFAPKARTQLLGMSVTQLYPDSAGTALGFSVLVAANFSQARKAFERQLGQPMNCHDSDGMHACSVEIAEHWTATLLAPVGHSTASVLGCHSFHKT